MDRSRHFGVRGLLVCGRTRDVSPKGDPAGLVRVLGWTRLAIPERPCNRRMDGFRNILENFHVGLILVIPGRSDTLRINGRAADHRPAGLRRPGGERTPTVLGPTRRRRRGVLPLPEGIPASRTWDPETWRPTAAPPYADIALALWRKRQPADEVRQERGGLRQPGLKPQPFAGPGHTCHRLTPTYHGWSLGKTSRNAAGSTLELFAWRKALFRHPKCSSQSWLS